MMPDFPLKPLMGPSIPHLCVGKSAETRLYDDCGQALSDLPSGLRHGFSGDVSRQELVDLVGYLESL